MMLEGDEAMTFFLLVRFKTMEPAMEMAGGEG